MTFARTTDGPHRTAGPSLGTSPKPRGDGPRRGQVKSFEVIVILLHAARTALYFRFSQMLPPCLSRLSRTSLSVTFLCVCCVGSAALMTTHDSREMARCHYALLSDSERSRHLPGVLCPALSAPRSICQ